jgi:hypothetical protein
VAVNGRSATASSRPSGSGARRSSFSASAAGCLASLGGGGVWPSAAHAESGETTIAPASADDFARGRPPWSARGGSCQLTPSYERPCSTRGRGLRI